MASTSWRRIVVLTIAGVLTAAIVLPWAWSRVFARELTLLELDDTEKRATERLPSLLRIGTYNIAHGRGLSESNWTGEGEEVRRQRLLDLAEAIALYDLDVVVLNEADFDASWSHGIDQAQVIAQAAGYAFVVEVPNYDVRIGPFLFRFGNAVLSRYPLRDAEVIDLPPYSWLEELLGGKKRGVAVTVEAPGGNTRVFAVHLSHRSEGLRVESAQHLVALARRCPMPVVIIGDMNSTPTSFPGASRDGLGRNALDVIAATGRWRRRPVVAPGEDAMTFHSTAPTRVIDWILAPRPWSFEGYRAVHSELSDHRPVVTTLMR